MKILYVAQWAGSPQFGMVYGHYYLASHWARQGHDVTVLSASYSHTRFNQPTSCGDQVVDGIRYSWVPVNKYRATSAVGRLLSIFQFTWRTMFYRERDFDVVICSSHHPFAIFPSRRIAARSKAKLVFEIRDLWPESLIQLGGVSRLNPIVVLMSMAERFSLSIADLIVSTLPSLNVYLEEKGFRDKVWLYIPNSALKKPKVDEDAVDDFGASPALSEFLSAATDRNVFNVVYCGNIGLANNLDSLIKAASLMQGSNCCVHIFGDGPERERLLSGLGSTSTLKFYGRVSLEDIQKILTVADLGYISYPNYPIYRYGISPTKINDYTMAGLPVVFAADFDLGELEHLPFIIKVSDQENEIADLIAKLSQTSERLIELGREAKAWAVNERSYENSAARYSKALQSLTGKIIE